MFDRTAAIERENILGKARDLAEIVRDEDHLRSGLGDCSDQRFDRLRRAWIEIGGGLVEEQEFRLAHPGSRQSKALLLAARKLAGWIVCTIDQTDPVEGVTRARADDRGAQARSRKSELHIYRDARPHQGGPLEHKGAAHGGRGAVAETNGAAIGDQ